MAAPSSDKAGVRQTYRALRAAGFTIGVQDGAHEEFPAPMSEEDAIGEVMSCDDGFFIVHNDGTTNQADRFGYVYFVFGNSPEEVINDYTTNLENVIEPMSAKWWDE